MKTIRLEWLVIKVTPNARLGGLIVDLRSRVKAATDKLPSAQRTAFWSQTRITNDQSTLRRLRELSSGGLC
jgi:hypothetical protein